MCGLVAIINRHQHPIELAILKEMADAIHHRGPDEEGHFIEGAFGFYHKRLSIIDLKQGRQPMTNEKHVIVFNGEIYNYLELKEELKKRGYVFKTNSDTEVLLKMYEEYDLQFLPYLDGMFALLIYDTQKQRIIAARDHFGIKPLYYFVNANHLLFASEIKALLRHPAVKAELNIEALHDYLTFQYVLGEATFFKNIFKILPGHYQVIDLSSPKIQTFKYWEPCFKIDELHTEVYFRQSLRELLEHTVKIQIRSDVPVGAYLSGGMDSSIVTLLAAKHTHQPFKTFTGAFNEGKEFDETCYAQEVANACGAQMFEIYPTATEFIELLPRLIYYLDEPVAGPGIFPQYIVSRLAAEHVKVVLGGQGGDEIFGGYARYVIAYLEQALKGAIFESNEEGEHIVSLHSILPNLPYLQRYIPMMQHFWRKDAFEPMERRYFHLIDRNGGPTNFFSEQFTETFDKEAIYNRFAKIFNHPDTLSYYNKMTHFDMLTNLPALLQVEDRMSMAVSLESRVPLLDRRIVDLVTRMPPAMKFKGAEMKYILKRAVGDLIPPKILARKDKMGFPVPLHLWAKNEARHFFCDILLSQTFKNRKIFDANKVEALIYSERPFGRQLWGMVCLELWFRTFIDRN